MTDNPTPGTAPVTRRVGLKPLVRALRMNQWTKNLIVLAAFFFAYWDQQRTHPLALADGIKAVMAAAIFCLLSSGIYILNDIRDIEADRHHPVKRHRPIASGLIPLPFAWLVACALIVSGLAASLVLPKAFTAVAGGYILIQLVYSYGLKRVALVDVLVIATGFVLRAMAGAVALTAVIISPWLLLCTFLLALFLALCKRRHEKVMLDAAHRESLEQYDTTLLDQLIAITSGATVVSYAIYTLWPETVKKFGTHALGFTVPFVVFGIFRYLDLVYRHDKGDRPEKILLTDLPLIATVGLYVLSLVLIFVLHF